MREFKLLNLSIFYENGNEIKLERQDIIARKTIFGNYKEIMTDIKFRPRCFNEGVFANNYCVKTHNLGQLSYSKLKFKELFVHDYCVNAIKKYGFVFILNKENNDFENSRIVTTSHVNMYGESFNSTKFSELLHKYNNDEKKYYKQNIKEINQVIKKWK